MSPLCVTSPVPAGDARPAPAAGRVPALRALPPLDEPFLSPRGGLALSPAGLALVAEAGTRGGSALGAAGAEPTRDGVLFTPLAGSLRPGGSASGSTMQIPGWAGRGHGSFRGAGRGSQALATPRPGRSESSSDSSPSARMDGQSSVAGGMSESERVGSDSLTDVGGVSPGRARGGASSWEGSLSDSSRGLAAAEGDRSDLGCSNSHGDTRHRSTSWGESERRPGRVPVSPSPQGGW